MQRPAAVGTAHSTQSELPRIGGCQLFVAFDGFIVGKRPVIVVFKRDSEVRHSGVLYMSVAGQTAEQCDYCQFIHES
jgi:hypothetical protein